jgi:myo-inositol-1(or 4)-monophosphatase
MKQTLLDCVRFAGKILLDHFGKDVNVRLKGEPGSVVTDAYLAAERCIVERIRAKFPRHSIVAEETGYQRRDSEFTWVIDPLDGTSNFAAGIPWFGVQIAVLQHFSPVMAAMFLPTENTLYFSEKGQGVLRNDTRVLVTAETRLRNVLCGYGVDACAGALLFRQQVELFQRVVNAVRNIRATNCLVDFGFTLDGRLGGCLNLNTKIWDIAPFALMLPEAGGQLSDLTGADIVFHPDTEPFDRSYGVLGASRALHPQLLALVTESK